MLTHPHALSSTLPAPPLQNQLLSELPPEDWQALRAGFEDVQLTAGTTLYEAGSVLRHVYFPTTAIVSLTSTMLSGATAEVAVVGHEGIVGVCAYMGHGRSLSSALVQGAGHAWKMPAAAIRQAAQQSAPLMQALLGYTQALFAQMAQTSACCRHHSLDQQLCRWLLLHLDLLPSAEMAVTQERIAHMLGVRREGVTMAALKLQKAGLIRYGRGRIEVLDRSGLEARSCECYAVVRGAHERLSLNAGLARDIHQQGHSQQSPHFHAAPAYRRQGVQALASAAG
jgi:CRP-like cAMP-binding protein